VETAPTGGGDAARAVRECGFARRVDVCSSGTAAAVVVAHR